MITRFGDGPRVILKRRLEIPKRGHRRAPKAQEASRKVGARSSENRLFFNIMKRYFLHFQGSSTIKYDQKQWLLLAISSLYAAAEGRDF